MKGVMEFITAEDCKFMDYVRNYSGEKVIIYGAALGAKRVISFLEKNDIYPEHVVVDEKYYSDDVYLGKYKIEKIEDVFTNANDIFDVIVAFAYYKEKMLEKYKSSIKTILDYEIFYGALEMGGVSIVPRKYYEEHKEYLDNVYDSLEDELSKKSMISYINQRISGEGRYSEGLVRQNQYFDEGLIDFGKQSLFVDCGAFNGNDSRKFFDLTDDKSEAFVFEPEKDNMKNVKENLQEYGERVSYIEKGVLDLEKVVWFNSGDGAASAVNSSGDERLLCTTLDTVFLNANKKVTFIKMDIEGSEMKALKGGEGIIKRDKPVLAICVYHCPDDIFQIPMYIKSLNPEYKLYIRRHDSHMIETVLYAI